MCTGPHDFIEAPGVVKAQIIFDASSQKVENVYHILSGAGVALADLDRIQGKLATWLTTNWKPNSSSGVSCALMVLNDESVENGVGKEYIINPAIVGSAAGGNLPLHNTVAIKWSTGLTGRSFRGRTYHVGLVPGHISGNQLSGGFAGTLGTMYNALKTTLSGGGTVDKLVVVSRCNNNVWRSTAVVTEITGASVDINVDSQRRRLTGRGR